MLILLLPFLIVSGIIFVTVDLAILFREKIASSYGNSFYLSVYFILAIYVIWSAVSAYRSGKLTAKSASSLILSSVIYFLILRSFDYPIERIHFVEYGALAISAIHGLRKRYAFKTALAAAVLLSTLTGLVDEFIQYIHPDRVGEIRDVLINLSAA
ncbi:MAG: VanZ family protein, partial [Fibrobacteres bacterium]|nr:VanZ family protein [Fibrobacterota bacterium]